MTNCLGDLRPEKEIMKEGRLELQQVLARGIHISQGHGKNVWDMNAALKTELDLLYATSKSSLRSYLSDEFLAQYENKLVLTTCANNKEDHVSFPRLGEQLRYFDNPFFDHPRFHPLSSL